MKRIFTITLSILCMSIYHHASAQEQYGKTLNLGLGVGGYSGYYGYLGHFVPVINLNYEFDVARNFTLAPFVSFYTFSDKYNWENNTYTYRETVVPIGIKGAYYFDEIFDAHSNWDFYAAGSIGFAIVSSRWDSGYTGDKNHFRHGNPLFLDIHIGAEYHFNSKVGAFLDLSSGVSTIGLAFHKN